MEEENKKLNICLVSYTGLSVPEFPLGVAYISAVLKNKGYYVTVIDVDHLDDKYHFDYSNFDVIGFTAMAGKSLSIPLHYINKIKSKTNKTVIVGGPLAIVRPKRFLKETKADYVITGEGEETILQLINLLEEKITEGKKITLERLKTVPNLCYRYNNEIYVNPTVLVQDLDSLPTPDLEAFDMRKYLSYEHRGLGKKCITLYTSRGCIYNCKFCHPALGRKWRGQSAKRIIEDITYFKRKYDIKGVLLYDELFPFPPKRIEEFCELVKPLKIKWGCQSRANLVNEETLKKMKEAGCVLVKIGLESGSDRMLKYMNKGITIKDSWNCVKAFKAAGLKFEAGFMVGMPTETYDEAKQTLKLIKDLYKYYPNSNLFTYFYTPRPDTAWYKLQIKQGMEEYTLEDCSKLDKGKKTPFNPSNMSEKQIKSILFRASIYTIIHSKDVLKILIKQKIKTIIQGIKSRIRV